MNIMKEFCNKNCKNVDDNIFDIIENNMEDGLDLLKITRNDISEDYSSFLILVDKELTIFLKSIEDYVYDIEILDIKLKMEFMERRYWYHPHKKFVNIFLIKCSLILLDNPLFLNYLVDTYEEEKYQDLLKYYKISKSGWLKPKFNILNLFKINF